MNWTGSAGVCVNDKGKVLMVLQGAPDEPRKWTVPSGGVETGETLEMCCKREFQEETGYEVEVLEKLQVKEGAYEALGISYSVHYFRVEITGGDCRIEDPDGLIHEVAWKSAEAIRTLDLSFPDDLSFLIEQSEGDKKSGKGGLV